ncbi:hypothetical protein HU765_20020, partial [Pseudomonas sp. SWRI81]|uniref:hypothetical protein n=1 Tax=Pseudomonas sp. SWRI81 TaxID=2745505 RepID=UPI0016474F8C
MANDDGIIEDESEGGGKHDDPEVLWVAPVILKPMPGRVYQGFDIDALIVIPGALLWNIDIYIGPTRLKRFSGWPLGGVGIFQTVPPGLIPPGAWFYFKIEYKMPIGWSAWAWSGDMEMAALPKPAITGVTVSADRTPTISGTGGVQGAVLEIWYSGGGGGVQLSQTLDSDGAWSITASSPWPVKEHIITAKQNKYGDSGWADAYTFTVRPPTPVIGAVTVSVDLKPTISGTGGIKGAVLEIFNSGAIGGVQLSKTLASDGDWSIAASSPWPVKKHSISARQTLGSHSGWAKEYEFTVSPPATPVIGGVTVSVDLKPTISGTGGISGALLQIFNTGGSGGVQLSKTLASNGAWSIAASAPWSVKKHSITAKQNLGSDSGWADAYEFTVRPTTPVIGAVSVSVDLKPTISGAGGIKGAVLEIFNSGAIGGVQLSKTLASDGDWSIAASSPWPVKKHSISARQTLGSHSGWAKEYEFTVSPPATPVIGGVTVSVDLKPTISGTGGISGALLQIFNTGGSGGVQLSKTLATNGAWSITASAPWSVKKHSITAKQNLGSDSGWADDYEFTVRPATPTITEPPPKTNHLGNVLVKGACMTGATVVVQDSNGNPIAGTLSYSATTWSFAYTWPPGAKHIKAVQTVDGQTSAATDLLEFYITPPLPTITEPLPKSGHLGNVLVKGACMTGATVVVQDSSGNPIAGTLSYNATTWSFAYTWPPGAKHIKAV